MHFKSFSKGRAAGSLVKAKSVDEMNKADRAREHWVLSMTIAREYRFYAGARMGRERYHLINF